MHGTWTIVRRMSRTRAAVVVLLVAAMMLMAACGADRPSTGAAVKESVAVDENTEHTAGITENATPSGAGNDSATTAGTAAEGALNNGDLTGRAGSDGAVKDGDAPSLDGEAVTAVGLGPGDELPAEVAAAYNRLGMLIFRQLLAQEASQAADVSTGGGGHSVFISPVSIALALGMAFNGAAGETEAAMAEAMQLTDLLRQGVTREELNAANLALLRQWTEAASEPAKGDGAGGRGVRLDIANSVWHRQELTFNPPFLQENERFYRAFVAALDFGAPDSVDIINKWVNDATNGLVPTVVDRLDEDQIMMLVNAVYFKGDWTTPFDARLTRDMPFHSASGGSRDVPMMYRDGRIEYFEDGFQAVRLPYGDDGRLAMYVFLPPADADFYEFAVGLTPEAMADAFRRFTPAQGEVLLPRMELAYKANLNQALTALGMGVAFDAGAADFGRMRPANETRNIYVGDVIHRSVLKVDEEGAEAAGVTSVDFRVTSLPVYDFRFQADRPFVVVIRDDATGALLFVGAVTDPGSVSR